MDKNEMIKQVKNAFEFMQKLYNESSYLVKEIEGQLSESEYKFQILKPSGYGISVRSSTGLEPFNVYLWLLRKFAIGFVEESFTVIKSGQTITDINDKLKVLYFRIILDDKTLSEPELIYGVFNEIEKYKDGIKKFENLMTTIEYIDNKLFKRFPNIDYKDGNFRLKGKFKKVNLLDINSSNELIDKVINPAIKIYEEK